MAAAALRRPQQGLQAAQALELVPGQGQEQAQRPGLAGALASRLAAQAQEQRQLLQPALVVPLPQSLLAVRVGALQVQALRQASPWPQPRPAPLLLLRQPS